MRGGKEEITMVHTNVNVLETVSKKLYFSSLCEGREVQLITDRN